MTRTAARLERPDQDRRKTLEAADRVLDDAVSSVACELRGPLRSVLRLSRLIREFDGAMDADTREYADYIRANTEHMAAMLNGLRRAAGPVPAVPRSPRAVR